MTNLNFHRTGRSRIWRSADRRYVIRWTLYRYVITRDGATIDEHDDFEEAVRIAETDANPTPTPPQEGDHMPNVELEQRMPKVEVHEEGEWSALYIDGKLDRVGDHYLADERIREIFAVEVVHDDAFMRGQNTRDGVAKTLDEVHAYVKERAERIHAAADKVRQAELLLAEARALNPDIKRVIR
jgi:hypothetical protein